MATIVALTSNVWSSTTNDDPWPGGTLPGAGDTVQCADYTITIDQNITVTAIELDGAHTGGFLVDTAPVSITANVIQSSSDVAPCLTLTHATGTVTITGTISTTGGGNAVYQTGDGDLTIVGSFAGGAVSTLLMMAGGSLDITGDVTGGSAFQSFGADLQNLTGTITVTGDVIGASTAGLNIVSDYAVVNVSSAIIAGSDSSGMTLGSYTELTVDRIVGVTDGTLCAVAVDGYAVVTVRSIEAALFSGACLFPIYGAYGLIMPAATLQIKIVDDALATRTLTDDYPAEADVKDGVTYNLGTLEGELAAGGGGWSILINGVISRT